MKFSCDKADFEYGVNAAMMAVPSKSTTSLMMCVIVEASGNDIKFSANNPAISSIECVVPGMTFEDGKVAIDAKTLFNFVRSMPNGSIIAETDEKNVLHLSCQKAKFDIEGLDSENYPYSEILNENSFLMELDQSLLKDMIGKTIFCVSDTESLPPTLKGVNFRLNNDGFRIYALDGLRVGIRNINYQYGGEEKQVSIPKVGINAVLKLLDNEGKVKIYLENSHVGFVFDNTTICMPLIDGKFMDIDKIFNTGQITTEVVVNTKKLIGCVSRALQVCATSIMKKPVFFEISNNTMLIYANTDRNNFSESIDATTSGEDFKIAFNPSFVVETLKNIEDEEVRMQFISKRSPAFIKPIEEKEHDYSYVILPVNTN